MVGLGMAEIAKEEENERGAINGIKSSTDMCIMTEHQLSLGIIIWKATSHASLRKRRNREEDFN